MKITEPKIEERAEQPYMGIRTQTTQQELGNGLIPQSLDEIFGWLEQQGVEPVGAPIMRFHVIDMECNLDIELGVPVASTMPGNGRIQPNSLPAGRYAALVYTGIENGVPANGALLDWGAQQGLVWDTFDSDKGDGFGSRYETLLMGPQDDPDPSNWDNEVAIRLADEQPRL
ncbi:MAG: GyrI-like domain-containing protein [Chloroflexi bacterium]|nr:GyrI-like domain-containing protein [Chloroflexota bacterium]